MIWLRTYDAADMLGVEPNSLVQYSWLTDIGARCRLRVNGKDPPYRRGGYFYAWRDDVIRKAAEIRAAAPRKPHPMGVGKAVALACEALHIAREPATCRGGTRRERSVKVKRRIGLK